MRVLLYILILSMVAAHGQSQNINQIIKDEAWVLQSKNPTQEERMREENTRWMLETSARHWSGTGEMTSEELNKLRSIYLNDEGKQKVDAFSIITFVEEIENWEGDLVQMLYSSEQAYVQSALNVLSAKMKKGSEHEKAVLANNTAIASRIGDLDSFWTENANIQNKVQQSKLSLEHFRLTHERVEQPVVETSRKTNQIVVNKVNASKTSESEVKEATEVAPTEIPTPAPEQSPQWWLWLVGALVVLGGVVVVVRRKS